VELTAAQQERYARHLLLDGFGGEGQERLLAAAVEVRGTGTAALWAARYLAASGVGALSVECAGWHDELIALGPWLALRAAGGISIAPQEGSGPAESAMNGAQAAVEAVRLIVRGGTG
jgi:hypothetical protein